MPAGYKGPAITRAISLKQTPRAALALLLAAPTSVLDRKRSNVLRQYQNSLMSLSLREKGLTKANGFTELSEYREWLANALPYIPNFLKQFGLNTVLVVAHYKAPNSKKNYEPITVEDTSTYNKLELVKSSDDRFRRASVKAFQVDDGWKTLFNCLIDYLKENGKEPGSPEELLGSFSDFMVSGTLISDDSGKGNAADITEGFQSLTE